MAEMHGQSFSWSVATHRHRERTNDWYWGFGLVALLGTALSLYFGNYLLAGIIVIGTGSIGMLLTRGPREHEVRLDRRGLSLDGTLYRFDSLRSFWVDTDLEHPRLFISASGILSPHFTLSLPPEVRPEDVRTFLKKFVPEEEQGPHVGEHIAEFFGV